MTVISVAGEAALLAASSAGPPWAPPALSTGPLGVVQATDREIARQTALQAHAVAEFAAQRPASVDRQQGEPGAMSTDRWARRPESLRAVSEWAVPELAVALSVSQVKAETLLQRSLDLVHRLPGTLVALEAGALHVGHLWPLLEHVAPIADDALRAEVEADLLRWAAGRVTTPAQLGDKARREVLKRDARAAARKLEKALAARGVHLRPGPQDGMATVAALLSLPEAHALHQTLGALADAIDEPGDARTRQQKMADVLLDLVLRPGESDLPPVQVLLTVVASVGTVLGGDAPGEVNGQVVPAEEVRQLVWGLAGRPAPAPWAADGEPAATVAGPRSEPMRTDGGERWGASDRAWEEFEQRELAAWWDETERRILAGDLVAPDLDGYADDPVDLPGGPPVDRPDQPPTPEEPPTPDPPLLPGRTRMPTPPATPTGTPTPPHVPARGWWRDADRAVEDAGLASRRLDEAMAHAHRWVRTAEAADVSDEAAWQDGGGGRVTRARAALDALAAAVPAQRAELGRLLDRTAGGGLADRPRIALADAVTGALVALTDLPALRRAASCGARACRRRPAGCGHDLTGRPPLGAPGPTDGYRPGAELDRFVRARDRRCRFPGCRRRVPRGGELDHDTRWPEGETSAANLAGYCTPDHRGKHQAPGWRFRLGVDGTLTVTTPTGLVAVTTPPPY